MTIPPLLTPEQSPTISPIPSDTRIDAVASSVRAVAGTSPRRRRSPGDPGRQWARCFEPADRASTAVTAVVENGVDITDRGAVVRLGLLRQDRRWTDRWRCRWRSR